MADLNITGIKSGDININAAGKTETAKAAQKPEEEERLIDKQEADILTLNSDDIGEEEAAPETDAAADNEEEAAPGEALGQTAALLKTAADKTNTAAEGRTGAAAASETMNNTEAAKKFQTAAKKAAKKAKEEKAQKKKQTEQKVNSFNQLARKAVSLAGKVQLVRDPETGKVQAKLKLDSPEVKEPLERHEKAEKQAAEEYPIAAPPMFAEEGSDSVTAEYANWKADYDKYMKDWEKDYRKQNKDWNELQLAFEEGKRKADRLNKA